jgi:hypothetical protein
LNHISGSRGGIAGVYQRHDWAAEKRAALDAWAARVVAGGRTADPGWQRREARAGKPREANLSGPATNANRHGAEIDDIPANKRGKLGRGNRSQKRLLGSKRELDLSMSDLPNLPVRNASTSEELANPSDVSRERVLQRLCDWRDRVHKLYNEIEQALQNNPSFRINREGKHTSSEELPQRVGITETEQPKIDILRVVRLDGTNAAILFPRGLWVIGANGRIDLRILPAIGSSETYMLVDRSEPLTGAAQWVRMPIGSPFEREKFDPKWLVAKLS